MTDNTAGIFWAFLTAILLAFQGVAYARPLHKIGILAASLLTNIVNFVVLGVLGAFFFKQGKASLLGIMAYSYGRFGYYKALFAIGPPRLTTIMSTAPLLVLVLGVFFLAEQPGTVVLADTALVVLRVIFVSYEPSGGGWFHRGIFWGFASALSLGVSTFIRKKGLTAFPDPMLTVAWANFIGAVIRYSLRSMVPASLFKWGGAIYGHYYCFVRDFELCKPVVHEHGSEIRRY